MKAPARPANGQAVLFYYGRSMQSLFQPGDCLWVQPARLEDIRVGDVVIFRNAGLQGEERECVHRIVAAAPDGLVARGDNNPFPDAERVTAANLVGRVTHVQRGARVQRVWGGSLGILQARWMRAWMRFFWLVRSWLVRVGGPYRWLRNSGLAKRLWRPLVQRVELITKDGRLVKYVCRGRTVARWWPEKRRFECRKPYDLILWGEVAREARQADWTVLKSEGVDGPGLGTIQGESDRG